MAGDRLSIIPKESADWRSEAGCADAYPETFFLYETTSGKAKKEYTEDAKSICRTCPVKNECLSAAIEEEVAYGEPHGIRGGLTHLERKPLVREARTKKKAA